MFSARRPRLQHRFHLFEGEFDFDGVVVRPRLLGRLRTDGRERVEQAVEFADVIDLDGRGGGRRIGQLLGREIDRDLGETFHE